MKFLTNEEVAAIVDANLFNEIRLIEGKLETRELHGYWITQGFVVDEETAAGLLASKLSKTHLQRDTSSGTVLISEDAILDAGIYMNDFFAAHQIRAEERAAVSKALAILTIAQLNNRSVPDIMGIPSTNSKLTDEEQ